MSLSAALTLDDSTAINGQSVMVTLTPSGGGGILTIAGVVSALPDGTAAFFGDAQTALVGQLDTATVNFATRFFTGQSTPFSLSVALVLRMSDNSILTPTPATLTVSPPPLIGGVFPTDGS